LRWLKVLRSTGIYPAFKVEALLEILDAIKQRRSVRAFKNLPIKKEMIYELIVAAIWAPSAVNTQPWHFTVIQNQSLLDEISAHSKQHMLNFIDQMAQPHASTIRSHLSDPNFHVFYHAPLLILISVHNDDWAVENAALAAENLMLAAYSHGLGTCWIGFAQKWLETAEGKKLIGIDQGFVPVAPIIVGIPSGETHIDPRRAPEVRWID